MEVKAALKYLGKGTGVCDSFLSHLKGAARREIYITAEKPILIQRRNASKYWMRFMDKQDLQMIWKMLFTLGNRVKANLSWHSLMLYSHSSRE